MHSIKKWVIFAANWEPPNFYQIRKPSYLFNMTRVLFLVFMLSLSLAFPQITSAQSDNEVPFNGIITDIAGNPIKGAKIYTIDKNFAAKSNKRGEFGLTNVQPTDTIHVIFKKEMYDIPVEGRKSIRIHLGDHLEAQEDEDIAALGYGFIKRRENLTPSSGISGEVLVRMGRSSLLECLRGLVAGLNIGPDGKANIRGINSLNAPQDPLYLVDDVQVDSFDFVNVYDVDHVEVLKDASIYGAQGANGAILVYTKRGGKK